MALLEKAVASKDSRLISRVLRNGANLHKLLTADMLRACVELSDASAQLAVFCAKQARADVSMDEGGEPLKVAVKPSPTPEVAVYLHLLILSHIMQHGNTEEVFFFFSGAFLSISEHHS